MSRIRRFRSAITGRFVKRATARRHPRTTVASPRPVAVSQRVYYLGEIADLKAECRHASALAGDLVEVLDEQIRDYNPGDADLARRVTAALDADRERTGVDEWEETDRRCSLYNAAAAVLEGRGPAEE